MTTITATEFKQNLGFYLNKALTEDIYITKNNKPSFKLTTPTPRPESSISQFFGTLPASDFNTKAARLERAMRKRV